MRKKILSYIILIANCFFLLSPLFSSADYSQLSAKNYLTAHAENSWSVLGLAALEDYSANLDFLKNISSDQAINLATPILALTANNKNPRTFSSTDYIEKLKSFSNNNQLGDVNSINDDIFGNLALISAGETLNDTIILNSKNFILQNQNLDGGWGYAVNASSDTDMTAAAITSLVASGVSNNDPKILLALNFLKSKQNTDGGFLSNPLFGNASNTASTAWVVWALNSLTINPDSWNKENNTPITYLKLMQKAEGYFSYQTDGNEDSFSPITTAYAVIALAGKTLPLKILKNTETQPQKLYNFRIEGSTENLCESKTTGPTAMDIVKNASASCGFSYNIKDTQYGPYLEQIANDKASGLIGWQYAVNLTSPSVGAIDYQLKDNDEVLWYFGNFNDKLTRLSLSSNEILTNSSVTATIEYQENQTWKPLSGALVYFGTNSIATDNNGQAIIKPQDGYYKIFAQKDGYVRSNALTLKVGSPTSASVSLSATIGQVKGEQDEPQKPDTISFIASPSNLDFGQLVTGQKSSKNFQLKNTGNVRINISSTIEGDGVFQNNLTINEKPWKNFSSELDVGMEKTVSAKLSIPNNYSQSGLKQGQMVLWAKAE